MAGGVVLRHRGNLPEAGTSVKEIVGCLGQLPRYIQLGKVVGWASSDTLSRGK